MTTKFIKYRGQRYERHDVEPVKADLSIPKLGPLSLKKSDSTLKGILWDVKIELKDQNERLLFKPVVDFDTKSNLIWFFEDIYSGLKRQFDLENDTKFLFKGKEYALDGFDKTSDPNYYLVAKVKS